MYGKANTHLLRISGVIHILNQAYSILNSLTSASKKNLSDDFKEEINYVINNENLRNRINYINIDSLNYAKSLGNS